jgi:hypothetical protein
MASALSSAINAIKYANISAKGGGTWRTPKEEWVKDTTWKEPKQIWVKNDDAWARATTETRYIKFNGSSSYINYVAGGGAWTTYHEFSIVLTSIATIQTLFSYGADITYCTFEIGTNGKVYVKTRYNSGNAHSVNHATALSLNTFYLIRIEFTDSNVYIRIRNISGGTVGIDYTNTAISNSLNTSDKFIGKKYNGTNWFSGYLLDLNMYGGTYPNGSYRHDCNYFLSSVVGGNTVTDTYVADGSQNLTISPVGTVISTTG